MKTDIDWSRLYDLQNRPPAWLTVGVAFLALSMVATLTTGIARGDVASIAVGCSVLILACWTEYKLLLDLELDTRLIKALSEQPWCVEAAAELKRFSKANLLRSRHCVRVFRIQRRNEQSIAQGKVGRGKRAK